MKYFGGIDYSVKYNYQNKTENVVNYVKYMLNRTLAMFKYTNLPDTLPQMELEKMLQVNGYCVVAKVNDELYAFNGGLGGEGDVYGRPTIITISNPALKFNKSLKINEECVIIQNDSMQLGLLPLYEKYCTMLNESDVTIILATINKRIQMLLSANDDNTVQSAKQFLKDIENGKLGVIAESKLFDSLKVNNSSNGANVNLRDLFELHQYIKASLYNEIGLGSNNNLKREHLLTAEVEVNSDNLYPLVDDMLECRRKALEKINEMFGTDIQVEFNSSWDYRVHNGEPIDTIEESDGEVNDESEVPAEQGTSEEPTGEQTIEPTDDEQLVSDTQEKGEVENDLLEEPTDEEKEEPVNEPSEEPTDEPKEEPTDEPVEEPTDESEVEEENGNEKDKDSDE